MANDILSPTTHPNDVAFRAPTELRVSSVDVSHCLVIGSCSSQILGFYMPQAFRSITCHQIDYNFVADLPDILPVPLETYGFQVIMLPLRAVMPERLFTRLGFHDIVGHQAALDRAAQILVQMLHGAMGYRSQRPITTYVCNFPVPQQNAMGRLMPRYDLRNPVHFVEMLNRLLAEEIAPLHDVHLIDIDQISANFGRKYIQDDVIWLTNHGSVVSDYDVGFDQGRLEKPMPVSERRVFRTSEFAVAVCREIEAMHRTLAQRDQVKLLIVDLDDTLWRGVVADEGIERPMLTEGWPVAFAEALLFLKKRGILLAIVSKNEESVIRNLWPRIYGNFLELADFAAVKINWQPKAENIAELLEEVGLLPRSVVFIDDNPVERASVQSAFPEIRVFGADPYALRRLLLWAPETQVAYITDESARRTEMIQAQVEREGARKRLTRGEFLLSLGVQVRVFALVGLEDQRFPRAFELVNKSNQFNTTGRRWTREAWAGAVAQGYRIWAFEVEDRYSNYGLVGVVISDRGRFEQFVMSCRVLGLEVETAVLTALIAAERRLGAEAISAAMLETDANLPCRRLYFDRGFIVDGKYPSGEDRGHLICLGFAVGLRDHFRARVATAFS